MADEAARRLGAAGMSLYVVDHATDVGRPVNAAQDRES